MQRMSLETKVKTIHTTLKKGNEERQGQKSTHLKCGVGGEPYRYERQSEKQKCECLIKSVECTEASGVNLNPSLGAQGLDVPGEVLAFIGASALSLLL